MIDTLHDPVKLARWFDAVARDYARAIEQRTPARTPEEIVERNALMKLHAGAVRRAAYWDQLAARELVTR